MPIQSKSSVIKATVKQRIGNYPLEAGVNETTPDGIQTGPEYQTLFPSNAD